MKRYQIRTFPSKDKIGCAYVIDTDSESEIAYPMMNNYYMYGSYEPYHIVIIDMDSKIEENDPYYIEGSNNVWFSYKKEDRNDAYKVVASTCKKGKPLSYDFCKDFCEIRYYEPNEPKYVVEINGEFKFLKNSYSFDEVEALLSGNGDTYGEYGLHEAHIKLNSTLFESYDRKD